MKTFTLAAIAATMVFGSVASANEGRRLEYRCELEAKGKGGECRAWGEIELAPAIERDHRGTTLNIRCTDGFRLRDRDARFSYDNQNDDWTIQGRDGDDRAVLLIEDVSGRTVVLDARLATVSDGDENRYRGECEVRPVEGDLDDEDDDSDV